jgi:hypothetical protein
MVNNSNLPSGLPKRREDEMGGLNLPSNISLTNTYNNMEPSITNQQTSGELDVNEVVTPERPKTQTSDFASSSLGDMELNRYLYESGLQNIFTDYQKNIQTLQQEQSQQLQNAYIAREMSKKYLGEYASNVGIGNVSGSLIDIYSQYAQNISDIDKNFVALEMNLTNEYTRERMTTFENLLRSQYQMEVAELGEIANDLSRQVFTDYQNDVSGGLAILDSNRENFGSDENFEMVRDTYYQANVDAAIQNISSEQPWFGFADLESRTLKTQEQYLEESRSWMSAQDFRRLEEAIAIKEVIAANRGEVDFKPLETSVNPTLFTTDPNVSETSSVLQLEGTMFAISDNDIFADNLSFQNDITPSLLNEQFEKQSGLESAKVTEGDIVQYQGFYIFQEGSWRRMINIGLTPESRATLAGQENNESFVIDEVQKQWIDNPDKSNEAIIQFHPLIPRRNFTLDNVEYEGDGQKLPRGEERDELSNKFNEIHGPLKINTAQRSVINVNGTFYLRMRDGSIYKMKEKK